MTNDQRIEELAQSIYLARYGQENDVTDAELTAFLDRTIEWVNQLTPEIEKKADWNFVRENDAVLGTVPNGTTISYELPSDVRKLVVSPFRDVTIRQDSTVVSSFDLVNPNQTNDPSDPGGVRDRATVIQRNLIFSRSLTDAEVGGSVVADTIAFIPKLTHDDVSLLDILDEYPDIRQVYVLGVIKNQILPDTVKGGLTPSYSVKFDRLVADCIVENNASADAYDQDRESFGYVGYA